MSTVDKIEQTVAPVVETSGLELVDVELNSRTVRVTLDRDGGVDLEAIGVATKAISRALDDADCIPGGSYELEVTSPGVERRLRRPDHYLRHVGADVAVKTKPGVEGDRRLEGRLAAADTKGIRIEGDAIAGGARDLKYGDIEKAHTIFDWRAALAGTDTPSARQDHKSARRDARQTSEPYERHGTETR